MTEFAHAVDRVAAGEVPEVVAAELLDELTTPEKLGLLDGDAPFWRAMADIARNGYNAKPLVAGAVARLGIPGIRWVDGPRGCAIPGSTCFPVTMARGATWDPALEERVGEAIGREIRAQGGNYSGCTVVNVLRHPGWGRAQETYGEDPVHLGAMGRALTRGAQRHVMVAVKHYALNSIEDSRFTLDVRVDERVLHEAYLPHFRDVVDAGVAGISTSYNKVNGIYCGEHPHLLSEIPRDEWGFKGIVSSDFVLGLRDPVASLEAGLDVEMPVRHMRHRALRAALRRGRLDIADVERSALRILATQLRHTAAFDADAPDAAIVAGPAHRALAREVATRATVLLQNAGELLPLDAAALRRVAVVGRLADRPNLGDHGSSDAHPPSVVTPLDGLRAALPGAEVVHAAGSDVAAVAADADVCVVVVGYDEHDEGERFVPSPDEFALFPFPATLPFVPRLLHWSAKRVAQTGGDRRDLRLRAEDRAVIGAAAAANPRTVVAVVSGSAVLLEDVRARVPAILMTWYPGMEGGHALADVLLGKAEPGGRLPFVVPTDPAHLPHFDPDAQSIVYDEWWGYRLLDRDGHAPAYPFGFGLGYTQFELGALVAEHRGGLELRAVLDVANVGARRGSTVVQLYGERQLLGFARVELEAGASTRVAVEGTLRPLARRDPASGQWELEPRSYALAAGLHAGDPAAQTTTLELVGASL